QYSSYLGQQQVGAFHMLDHNIRCNQAERFILEGKALNITGNFICQAIMLPETRNVSIYSNHQVCLVDDDRLFYLAGGQPCWQQIMPTTQIQPPRGPRYV